MSSHPCPPESTLTDFLAGRMSATEVDRIADHIEGCLGCRDALAELEGRTDDLVNALRRAGDPSRTRTLPASAAPEPPAPVSPPAPTGPREDVRTLLRRRLIVVSSVGFFIAAALGLAGLLGRGDAVANEGDRRGGGLVLMLYGLYACVALAYLKRRPLASISSLRRVEVGHLIGVTIYACYFRWAVFAAGAERDFSSDSHRALFFEQSVMVGNLCWYAMIVGYGVLIPNTLRRAAAVTTVLAAAAVLSIPVAAYPFPKTLEQVPSMIAVTAVGVTIGGAIGLFGSYRISTLQSEVIAARELGPYQLIRKLGSGGMGEVHLARHRLLKRPCAVKLIRAEQASDARALQRFEREVQATARLTHPNTVEVFDYGRTDDGTFYYVMEYLPGSTLAEIVKTRGPVSAAQAIAYLRPLCGALAEAHDAGLVHRDIKPGNVMVCERGGNSEVVKLLDFGLVHEPDADEGLTREGFVVGTPAYMSPEQASSRSTDRRSDVYSLGALAYFLVTGRPPFVADSVLEVMIKQRQETPESPRSFAPDLPEAFETIVLRALAASPDDRFRDTRAFDEALGAIEVTRSRPA